MYPTTSIIRGIYSHVNKKMGQECTFYDKVQKLATSARFNNGGRFKRFMSNYCQFPKIKKPPRREICVSVLPVSLIGQSE